MTGQAVDLEQRHPGVCAESTPVRPKGVLKPLPDTGFGVPTPQYPATASLYGVAESTVYLTPAPLYHAALIEFCRAAQFHIKCSRSVDFRSELPRLENGKLYKRVLEDEYWATTGGGIAN